MRSMQAWHVESLTGPDGLRQVEVPRPTLVDHLAPSVMIDVRAAGIAFPDVLMTRGGYQMQATVPFIPGIEVAGTVAETRGDTNLEVGQRVAAYTAIGGLAEASVASAVSTFALPDELDFAEGASLVVNYHTAYLALVLRGGLSSGDTVLVHGAAGGLGSAALQIVRGLGAYAIAVVSTEEKAAVAKSAGADEVVLVDAPWPAAVADLNRGIDLAFDPVGGDRALESLRLMREDGRLLIVGFTSGEIPDIRVNRLIFKNTSVVGAGWGHYIAARPEKAAVIAAGVADLVRAGSVRPLIGHRFAFEKANEAFNVIDRREALGKIVVDMPA